jgi:hypothetical protein
MWSGGSRVSTDPPSDAIDEDNRPRAQIIERALENGSTDEPVAGSPAAPRTEIRPLPEDLTDAAPAEKGLFVNHSSGSEFHAGVDDLVLHSLKSPDFLGVVKAKFEERLCNRRGKRARLAHVYHLVMDLPDQIFSGSRALVLLVGKNCHPRRAVVRWRHLGR